MRTTLPSLSLGLDLTMRVSNMQTELTVHEVLEYGPIMCSDADFGILITANGAYFNIWNATGKGTYVCSDCVATNLEHGLYGVDAAKLLDKAKNVLTELLNSEGE